MTALQDIKNECQSLADPETARHSQRFFKTGKGEYGEGDIFLGIRVPVIRQLAKKYHQLPLNNITSLLKSKYHEQRLLALIMLVNLYKKSDDTTRKTIFDIYINNFKYINNWDLIDTTTPHIVGAYLFDKDRSLLYEFAASDNLWKRRMSVLACFYFIKKNDFNDGLTLAELLLEDNEDLIHKAVGWMLREIGKKNYGKTTSFLDKFAFCMPRTMLRYALEKFPADTRKSYMAMKHRLTAHKS